MSKDLKLHIGCGNRIIPGFDHVDKADFPHINSSDITKLPYQDNTVGTIYASHVLEYFDREEVIPVLKEWKRVLKSDGKLYLSVPDFGAMTQLYKDRRVPLNRLVGPLFGKMKCNDETIYHKTVYDEYSLGDLLQFAGFRGVAKQGDFGYDFKTDVTDGEFDDHSKAQLNGLEISLNMCCKK